MSRNKAERKFNAAQYDEAFESICIHRRRCTTFVPDNPTDAVCHCNRPKHEHTNKNEHRKSNEKWQREIHTVKDATKDQGVCLINGSPYVRCDIETDPKVIQTILLDVWRIEQPTLLMQVTGGHKYFKLRGKMEVSLLNDLIEFVSNSNIWLLTNGMNLGIVQLIGQAIRKRKLTKPQDRITAISVCNFGYVKNIVDFQRFEHLDTTQPLLTREEQNFKSPDQLGEQNLEMNHTHFILLDDGRRRYYSIGDYRARLVKSISQAQAKQNIDVPFA